jgi:hypothetical protein
MRAWLSAALASARGVGDRPELWLPGALAWVVSVGWIPLVLTVARLPTDAELTFLGARFVSSGAWPWNAVLAGVGLGIVILVAFAVVAAANASLIAMLDRRPATVAAARRLFATAVVAALPTIVLLVLLVAVGASIAPGAFNAPEGGDAVVRLLQGLAPLLAALTVAIVFGAALAAVIGRGSRSLRQAPGLVVRLGAAGWAQVVIGIGVQVAFLVLSWLLLGVLWAPIGSELERGRIGVATVLLLVGFVAIWLCLLLGGGALHAWSATTWSRLLAPGRRTRAGEGLTAETG